nr:non-ribosomal peptide synthetase [Pseudoalteromonas sp. OANN1]
MDTLLNKHILLTCKDGELSVKAPKGALTKDIIDLIKSNKAALVGYLKTSSHHTIDRHITAASRHENGLIPLSFSQRRLWLIDSLQGGASEYNIFMPLLVNGPLDKQLVQKAFAAIINRHEILRTVYIQHDNQPWQKILSDAPFQIEVVDLSEYDTPQQQLSLDKIIADDVNTVFDLTHDIMLRATVVTLTENERHALLINMPHIASDGWSIQVLLNEFLTLYRELAQKGPAIPPLTLQYADFAIWQNDKLVSDELQEQLSYWRKQLAGLPAIYQLPLSKPRPDVKSFSGSKQIGQLSAAAAKGLLRSARQLGMTPFMMLHAALSLVMARHAGENEFVIGTPVANRNQAELEKLIGCFMNTLVLRARVDFDSVGAYLAHIKQTHLDAQLNQDVPFEQLVEELQVPRSTSYSPLFQVLLTTNNDFGINPDSEPSQEVIPGVSFEPLKSETENAKFDISVEIRTNDEGVRILWVYDVALFDAAYIKSLNSHLCNVLSQFANLCNLPSQQLEGLELASISLLDEVEKNRLLNTYQRSGEHYPIDKCLHHSFSEAATKYAQNTALEFGAQSFTYAQLDAMSNRLARYLKAEHGVGPDVLVGVYTERSVEMVIAILAILKADGAYVPLDPNYPKDRLSFMVDDSGVKTILTTQSLKQIVAEQSPQLVYLDDLSNNDLLWLENYSSTRLSTTNSNPNQLAYVIYTSGSTGQPKGVVVEHRSIQNFLQSMADSLQCSPDDVVVFLTSINFDIHVLELYLPLINGCKLVLVDEVQAADPKMLGQVLEKHKINLMQATPATWRMLLETGWQWHRPLTMLCGGEALSRELADALITNVPQGVLYNMYGPTEATVWSSMDKVDPTCITLGRPIANTQLYILDQYLNPVPNNVPGELYIGGDGLVRGYLNREALTGERFVHNPFYNTDDNKHSQRIYRTGDLVLSDSEGRLKFIGRSDDQVKINGFRIELGEIGYQLQTLSDVESAVVVVRDIADSKQLVAYLRFYQHREVDTALLQLLQARVAQNLPSYMRPSLFISIEQWPLTPNGKIDKNQLPAPDTIAFNQNKYEAPISKLEHELVELWAETLSLDAQSISVTDNFFSLGGHSLLLVRLISMVKLRYDAELSVATILTNPTIRHLACELDKGVEALRKITVLEDRQRPLPLSFAQYRLWLIDNLKGSSPEYNMPLVFQLEGPFRLDLAEQAFATIVARHEVLRTVFRDENGETSQYIRPTKAAPFALETQDFSHLEGSALESEVKQKIAQESMRSFDLQNDLMLRVVYFKKSSNHGVLVINMHHIASDGWSLEVIKSEFFALYDAYNHNMSSPLPELTVQYADFAYWQREHLEGDLLNSQLAYWQQQLVDLPVVHSLPLSFSRPKTKLSAGASWTAHLNTELSDQLHKTAKKHQLSPFMLMHGMLSLLFSRHSNCQDIVIGTPVANRLQPELNALIGFFVNTLVIRTSTKQHSLGAYLSHVRQQHLDAQSNQDVPFELLVDNLNIPRTDAHTPLFQIMLTTNTGYDVNQYGHNPATTLADIKVSPFSNELTAAKFDLDLNLNFTDQGMILRWTYDTNLFSKSYIQRLQSDFERLLTQLVAEDQTDRPLSDLTMLSEDEQQHLLIERNATIAEYPTEQCIHQYLEQQALLAPEKTAVVCNNRRIDYKTINEKANQLAHYLMSNYQIGPDTLVGLCVERSIEMVIGILSILKAGGAYVPLDPSYPRGRLSHIIKDADLTLTLTLTHLCENLQSEDVGYNGALLMLNNLLDDNVTHPWSKCRTDNPCVEEIGLTSNNLAYVIYTSGSTGKPKGVMLEHQSVVNYLTNVQHYPHSEIRRTVMSTSLNFDATVTPLFGAWARGVPLDIVPETNNQFELLLSALQSDEAAMFKLTPAHLQALDIQTPILAKHVLVVGGEAFPQDLARRMAELMPNSLFINEYGPTEATVGCSYAIFSQADLPHIQAPEVSIGRPILNTQLLILGDNGELLPDGVTGELYIGGAGLARGYLNNPKMTAQRFIANPWYNSSDQNSPKRLYRTGDLARYQQDDNLMFAGRSDEQVKVRGFRIELGEIEHQLNQLPQVDSALVQASTIAETTQLIAYIQPEQTLSELKQDTFIQQLKANVASQLPDYMIPGLFVVIGEWPLTPNGKIDKQRLPQPNLLGLDNSYIAPKTETEIVLVEIWAELLGLPAENLSVQGNFFALGGHSLHLIRMKQHIQARLNLTIEPRKAFEMSTIQQLAKHLDSLQTQNYLKEKEKNITVLSEGTL